MTENIFNKSQQKALAALGLPLWKLRASVAEAQENLATENPVAQNSEAGVSHCYRLGPWLLLFTERLPVKHPQWLVDIALALGQASSSAIAEVPSASKEQWDSAFIVTVNVGIQDTIPASMKAKIWHQIQNQLS